MDVKKYSEILTIVLWLVGGILMLATVATAAPNPNFHIYIAYGQSNMAGNGDINVALDQNQYSDHFLMLASHTANAGNRSGRTNQSIETGKWYTAIPPMFHAFENLSPADWFGRYMVDSLPGVTVGIIPVAVGGVSIRAFLLDQYAAYFNGDGSSFKGWANDYGGNPMGRILELAKKAQEVGVIKGVLFHQGESDGTDDNWRNNVYKSYKTIIDELGLDENEVPFVAGELLQEGNNCCGSKNGDIAKLSTKFKKFGLASSKGLQGNGKDPYHFGRDGVVELGRRYCAEMLKLIDRTIDPDAPAVDLVDPSQSTVPDEPPEEYGPYGEEPAKIPGTIEVEEYNKGGADKGYNDLSKGNEGGKFRKNDVDIYQPNMGLVVGHCQTGEWLKYTVNVETAGEYEISAVVASDNTTGGFELYMDDARIGEKIVSDGKGFTEFTTVSGGKATLTAGEHELKLEIVSDWIDIDNITFKAVSASGQGGDSTTAIRLVKGLRMTEAESNFELFDLQGNRVARFSASDMAGAMSLVQSGALKVRRGMYMLRGKTSSGMVARKVGVYAE